MILTGKEIEKCIEDGSIKCNPYAIGSINPNSIDIHLSSDYIEYCEEIIDPAKNNKYETKYFSEYGTIIRQNQFILAASKEEIGSDKFVPILHGKSSIARAGLFAHVTADLIDIGSFGKITLQLYPTVPIKLYAGMPIAQVSFWLPKGEITLYNGKYKGIDAPVPSKSYLDKFWNSRNKL